MSGRRPPRLASLLLRLLLPRATKEFVLGDLEEEFGRVAQQEGGRAGRRWYWRQALGSILRSRRTRNGPPGAGFPGSWWPDSVWQDVRFALRSFGRRPLFTAAALVTLSLGIGATTAVFGVANEVLLRAIPGVREPDRLAEILFGRSHGDFGFVFGRVSYPNLDALNERLTGFERLAGYQGSSVHIAAAGAGAEPVSAQFVTPTYFPLLGVQAVLGRTFAQEEDDPVQGGSPVAVLSHRLWAGMFGRDPNVLGRTVRINRQLFSIVGVLPERFHGTDRLGDTDVWLPGSTYPTVTYTGEPDDYADRGNGGYFSFVARLAPGATWERAEAELERVSASLAELHPEVNDKFTEVRPEVHRGVGLPPFGRVTPGTTASTIRLLFGIVGLILLIACANVANLLLLRGVLRRGERTVRNALGATRGRLIRQHLTENLLLWVGGGALGLAVAWAMTQVLRHVEIMPFNLQQVPIDWRVAGFALGASLLTGLIFGLLPAVFGRGTDLLSSLKDAAPTDTGGRPYVRSGLTVLQIAATLALLVGALLFVGTLRHLGRVELGFEQNGVSLAYLRVGANGYSDAKATQYYRSFVERLERSPGVTGAALSSGSPFHGGGVYMGIRSVDRADDAAPVEAIVYETTEGIADVLGLELLRGRWFTPDEIFPPEGRTEGVAVVTEALAEELFGSEDPIDRQLGFGMMGREGRRVRIVGVFADIRTRNLDRAIEPVLVEPLGQDGQVDTSPYLLARSTNGQPLLSLMHTIAHELDPLLPLSNAMTLDELVSLHLSDWRAFANLLTLLAVLAITLAAVGLYGVVGFAVAARTRELGVRIAIGADTGSILALVLRRGLMLAGLGIVAGLGGAFALSKVVESRLVGVTALDPASYVVAIVVLAGVAIGATLIPARRATRVDPTTALRYE